MKIQDTLHDLWSLIRHHTLYVYLVFCILLIILDYQQKPFLLTVRSNIANIVFTVSGKQNEMVKKILFIGDIVRDYFELYEKYQKVKEEKLVLENYFFLTKHLEQENLALKKLLNVIPERPINFITTQILGDISSPFSSSLMVTGGEQDGVVKGQVVINQEGLVGRVVEVAPKNSRILLVNDLNSRIPVITEKSRERSLVIGMGDSNLLKLAYLPDDTKVEIGEYVFTSGDGKLFPPGLLIGFVSLNKNGVFYIKPAVDFNRLDYVVIVGY